LKFLFKAVTILTAGLKMERKDRPDAGDKPKYYSTIFYPAFITRCFSIKFLHRKKYAGSLPLCAGGTKE